MATVFLPKPKVDAAAKPTPLFPPVPVTGCGSMRFGGKTSLVQPEDISDAGVVRLGGQGPNF